MITALLRHLRRSLVSAAGVALRRDDTKPVTPGRAVGNDDHQPVERISRAATLVTCRISAASRAQASSR